MKKILLLFSFLSIVNSNDIIGYCDIKGSVNKPGVYEVIEGDTINDIVIKAGGLKKNSYTNNINLSKLVNDEMVIYVHNNGEIKKIRELNNCDCSPIIKYIECEKEVTTTTTQPMTEIITTTTKINEVTTTNKLNEETTTVTKEILNTKVNLNTANLEELMTLKGLGESKAKKIIEYRDNNGLFKNIEDLLNVDGIGNKTFENIKDYIEI